MSFYQSTMFANLTSEGPTIDFDAYDPEEIRFAISISFPSTPLVGKSRETPAARDLAQRMTGRPVLWSQAVRSVARRKNVEMAVTTPFTLADKIRTEGYSTIGSTDLSKPQESIKVPVADVEVVVPQHLSLPNPQHAERFAPERSPYDFQAANAAYFVGCYTRWSQSAVHSAINSSVLDTVKTPHLTQVALGTFVATVTSVAAKMRFARTAMNGVEWSSEFYRQLCGFSPADRTIAVVALCRPLMAQVMKDNPLSKTHPSNGTRPLKQSEIHSCGPSLSKDARLQLGNIPVASSMPVSLTGEVAYNQLQLSRQFRGSDDRGLSGMTVGAYTGEIISKLSASVRDIVAIIHQFDFRSYSKVILKGVNPQLAYHVAANFSDYQQLWFEMPYSVDAKLGMNTSRFIENKKGALMIDLSIADVQKRGGSQSFYDYECEIRNSIISAYNSHARFDPDTIVIRHRAFSALVDGAFYFVPPSPHNAVQTIVYNPRDPDRKKNAMHPKHIPELIIRANRIRDAFPYHRKPVWGLLANVMADLSSPLRPYRLASRLKAASIEMQQEALLLGIEVDFDEPVPEGFTDSAGPEPPDVDQEDDRPLTRTRPVRNREPAARTGPPTAAEEPPPDVSPREEEVAEDSY